MKFGKRFLSYQGNKDPSSFLDYKGVKQAIKADCERVDHLGSAFENVRLCLSITMRLPYALAWPYVLPWCDRWSRRILHTDVILQSLNAELNKVDLHYSRLEEALQVEVAEIESQGSIRDKLQRLANARQSIQEITNFAALNYSAVLKAVKKRNRRLQLACGDSAITAASYDFLADKSFFRSTTLAQVLQSAQSISQVCLVPVSCMYAAVLRC